MTKTHGTLLAGVTILVAVGVSIAYRSGTSQETPPRVKSPLVQKNRNPLEKPIRPPYARASSSLRKSLPDLPPPVISPYSPESAENRKWIDARISELDRLAWFDDSGSLNRILAELQNPLPEIRKAALAGTIAFSNREAIPYLEAIAQDTREPTERKALDAAIDLLRLPTMIEHLDRQPPIQPPDSSGAVSE